MYVGSSCFTHNLYVLENRTEDAGHRQVFHLPITINSFVTVRVPLANINSVLLVFSIKPGNGMLKSYFQSDGLSFFCKLL